MSYSIYGRDTITSGDGYVALYPKFYKKDNTKMGILFVHGNTGTAANVIDGNIIQITTAIANAGYPVLSCDFGGPTTWGNTTAINTIAAAKTYLQSTMGAKAGKIILVGQSAGGLLSLNWASTNLANIAAFVGLMPVVNLTDVHTNNRGGVASQINTAYGGSYSEAAFGAARNPQTMATNGLYAGLPMMIYSSVSDTIVLDSIVTTFVNTANVTATRYSIAGGHDNATFASIPTANILSFIATYS